MIAAYLREHEYSNVDSADLKEAIERAAGRNLTGFFEDWIVGGGGHPRFEVSYRWTPERKQVDLTVRQIQSDLPFENDFRIPVDVEIADANGRRPTASSSRAGRRRSRCRPRPPDAGDVRQGRLARLRGQVHPPDRGRPRGALRGRPRGEAARGAPARRGLSDGPALARRAVEAARGSSHPLGAQAGGGHRSREDRRLVGSACADEGARGIRSARPAGGRAGARDCGRGIRLRDVRRAVETDRAEDVIAAAEISLGRLRAPGTKEYLMRQLPRESRWWDSVRLGALIGLGKLGDPSLGATFAKYTAPGYVQDVRIAAMNGWLAAAPNDPSLASNLRTLASDRNRSVRLAAIQAIGKLHRAEDRALLEALQKDPDPTSWSSRPTASTSSTVHQTGRRAGSVAHRNSWKFLSARKSCPRTQGRRGQHEDSRRVRTSARWRRGRLRPGSHHDPCGGLDRRRLPVLSGPARLQRVNSAPLHVKATSGASWEPARSRRPWSNSSSRRARPALSTTSR